MQIDSVPSVPSQNVTSSEGSVYTELVEVQSTSEVSS